MEFACSLPVLKAAAISTQVVVPLFGVSFVNATDVAPQVLQRRVAQWADELRGNLCGLRGLESPIGPGSFPRVAPRRPLHWRAQACSVSMGLLASGNRYRRQSSQFGEQRVRSTGLDEDRVGSCHVGALNVLGEAVGRQDDDQDVTCG